MGDPTGPSTAAGERSSWRDEERRRERRRGILGCLGCGGAGIVGTVLALSVVLGGLSTQLSGCDLDLSTDPGDGRASQRLDVLVAPATGLDEGTVVTVGSRAFEPSSIVGVAVCLDEADTDAAGVEACDEVQGARYATDADGVLRATYPVPRTIAVGGRTVDCAERPGRCVLVAADANDYDRSGGQPLAFDASTPAPVLDRPATRPQTDRLPVTAEPPGPFLQGAEVALTASGFQPGEPVLAAWCTSDFATEGPRACEPIDASTAVGAVVFRSLGGLGPIALRADGEGRVRTSLPARATIRPFSATDDAAGAPRSDGRFDCRAAPDSCWFVIAAAADTKRSAVLPYEVTPR